MEDISGRRVLVVEDEALVLMLLTDMVEEAGAVVVGPASSVPEACEIAARASAFNCSRRCLRSEA